MIENTELDVIAVGGAESDHDSFGKAALAALARLANEELLTGLDGQVASEKRCMANVIAYLGEVEERRLHLEAAYPSMFAFCQRRLRLSEGEAFRRIRAARLARKFPILLPALAERRVTLSNVVLMYDYFTEENVGELLGRMEGKTKLEVKELIAKLAPRADVPPTVMPVGACQRTLLHAEAAPSPAEPSTPRTPQPLSSDRYLVSFTASTAFRDKLERARDLLRHRIPDGDLEAIFSRAVDALIAQLDKEVTAKTDRPRPAKAPQDPGDVPRAARREVMARDGFQCTYISPDGARCAERGWLEVDHRLCRARGGTGAADNLRVLCRAHNQFEAVRVFGRAHVEKHIREKQRGTAPTHLCQNQPVDAEVPETRVLVETALVGLGFRKSEVQRALLGLGAGSWRHPVPDLLREVIGALT